MKKNTQVLKNRFDVIPRQILTSMKMYFHIDKLAKASFDLWNSLTIKSIIDFGREVDE